MTAIPELEYKITSLDETVVDPKILELVLPRLTSEAPPKLASVLVKEYDNGNMYDAANKLLDPEVASLFLKAFEVGDEKMIFYGNPLIMSSASGLFLTLLNDMIKEAKTDASFTLAPGLSVHPYPESFLSVWLFMNGITNYYILNTTEKDRFTLVSRLLRIWDWIKYFDLGDDTESFQSYIAVLGINVSSYLLDLSPALAEGKTITTIKIPQELVPNIRDIHEHIKVNALEDKFLTDDDTLRYNINSLFSFILGEKKEFNRQEFEKDGILILHHSPGDNREFNLVNPQVTHSFGYPNQDSVVAGIE